MGLQSQTRLSNYAQTHIYIWVLLAHGPYGMMRGRKTQIGQGGSPLAGGAIEGRVWPAPRLPLCVYLS